MKKIFGFILISIFVFEGAFAQNTSTETEKPVVEAQAKKRDRLIFTIGFDNLFHKMTNGFATKWHSRGIGFYYMHDIPIKNSKKVSFAPGLGIQYSNYYHNSSIYEDSLGTNFTPIDNFKDDDNYKRHKLSTTHLEVPLELRFFSEKVQKNGNQLKAAVGFKTGVKLSAFAKEVRRSPDGYFKRYKEKGFHDVNIVRAGPTFRIGYGAFNVFAFYSVTHLFKKDRGPEMTPFSIGISFNTL